MPILSDHSLLQLDDEYLRTLERTALCDLSVRLLADLKEARERLKQNPSNSSRPPSSRAPWERVPGKAEDDPDGEAHEDLPPAADEKRPDPKADRGEAPPAAAPAEGAPAGAEKKGPAKRRPGKQPGAPGKGRTQVLRADAAEHHRPDRCAGCGRRLSPDAPRQVYTAFSTVDLQWGDPEQPGLHLRVTEHRYEEVCCPCGHHTRAAPARTEGDPAEGKIPLSEWRLVGPGLAALIVALNMRFRMSRARIREFLWEWLGLQLSVGTLHQTLREAAAAAAPAEPELIKAVQTSGLLHGDETSWLEQAAGGLRWLWVLIGAQVVYYAVADRGKETLLRVLAGFEGWLMSDGWCAYRYYPQRLRCWAHLIRKAKGLMDSCRADARAFGRQVHDTLERLMAAVYAAREGPPGSVAPDLSAAHASLVDALHQACRRHLSHPHAKTQALAVEFCNDWEAIFQVLKQPHLPLTNNEAERALRHWVISRRLSYGTRTAAGSRDFALLASVIDTCRLRGHSPWRYIATGIADRRAGRPLAALPGVGI